MKQLLVDYLPFEISPEQITESVKENNGKLIVRGVLQRAEAKNQNGRVYPKEILMREANAYNKNFVKQSRAMGELDHPESSVVNLANVSHNITDMHWKSDDLVGTVEVLTTPSGNILRELFKNGIPYWLNDGCYAWVIDVDDYCCTTNWDASCQSMYDYCQLGWPT